MKTFVLYAPTSGDLFEKCSDMNYPILERIYDLTDVDFTIDLRFCWINEKGYFKTRSTEEFNKMFNQFIKDMKNGYLEVLYYGYLNYVKKEIAEKYLGANEIFKGSYYEQREYWIRTVEKFINELYNSREEKDDSYLWIEAYTRDGTGFYFRFYIPVSEIDNIMSNEVISLIKDIRNPDSSMFMLPMDYFTLLELGSWIVFEYALHSYYYYLCRTIKTYDESKLFEKRTKLEYMYFNRP
ncbi:MAG: hypothetical protein ACOX1L_06480 [Erysipelotrichaceae bacterium]|jgi:hypothetical protein